MKPEIQHYNDSLSETDKAICDTLAATICTELNDAEYKIWHAHPVWFLNENPIVGYSKQKPGIRLMFWSGADFDEAELHKAFDWFSQRERRFGRTSAQLASQVTSDAV